MAKSNGTLAKRPTPATRSEELEQMQARWRTLSNERAGLAQRKAEIEAVLRDAEQIEKQASVAAAVSGNLDALERATAAAEMTEGARKSLAEVESRAVIVAAALEEIEGAVAKLRAQIDEENRTTLIARLREGRATRLRALSDVLGAEFLLSQLLYGEAASAEPTRVLGGCFTGGAGSISRRAQALRSELLANAVR